MAGSDNVKQCGSMGLENRLETSGKKPSAAGEDAIWRLQDRALQTLCLYAIIDTEILHFFFEMYSYTP